MVTPEVRTALAAATDVIGYFPYVARIAPRPGLTLHGSDNRVEIDRADLALNLASEGAKVVIVSSGDPGVFAMASALFEALEKRPDLHALDIKILPGITAMLAAAAHAGAPLGHDFCAINLSDNLKPWELVEHRLRLAAQADFAMGFYNPRSARRPHQFARALEILREECGPTRLITFARAVTTPEERITTVTLAEASPEMADMRTVVLVGNSATRRVGRLGLYPEVGMRQPAHHLGHRAHHLSRRQGRALDHDDGQPQVAAPPTSLAAAPAPPEFLATIQPIRCWRNKARSPATSNGPRASTTVQSGRGGRQGRIDQPQQIVVRQSPQSRPNSACQWPGKPAPQPRAGRQLRLQYQRRAASYPPACAAQAGRSSAISGTPATAQASTRIAAHLRRERMRGIDHSANPFGAQIVHQARHTAKAADPQGQGLRHRSLGAPGIREHRLGPRRSQCPRQGRASVVPPSKRMRRMAVLGYLHACQRWTRLPHLQPRAERRNLAA